MGKRGNTDDVKIKVETESPSFIDRRNDLNRPGPQGISTGNNNSSLKYRADAKLDSCENVGGLEETGANQPHGRNLGVEKREAIDSLSQSISSKSDSEVEEDKSKKTAESIINHVKSSKEIAPDLDTKPYISETSKFCPVCAKKFKYFKALQRHLCKHESSTITKLFFKEAKTNVTPRPGGIHECELCHDFILLKGKEDFVFHLGIRHGFLRAAMKGKK